MEVHEIIERLLIPVGTAIGGYFVGKPREKAEIEGVAVRSASDVIDKWGGYADRLENNIEQLSKVINELHDALKIAKDEKLACQKSLEKLQKEYDELLSLYNALSDELDRLRSEKNTIVQEARDVGAKGG